MKFFNKTFEKTCPYCGSTKYCLTSRPRNWRLLPFGQSYSCRNCNSQYIGICDYLFFLVERGFNPFSVPESDLDAALHSD